eukprot:GDKK01053338.1.p1 GENE.GDKK01053338.1~~GDKK01053338.1.p1  ORF type:complete len:204 (-),score=41.62 GDKK01053338.1:85-696(-)
MSRVRMPHNNRVSASAALRTNDMWSRTIGHDPYAADSEKGKQQDQDNSEQTASLMLLAKMSNLSGVESRGGCKKCGMLGHMTFQCRNTTGPVVEKNDESSSSSSSSDEDEAPARPTAHTAQSLPQASHKADSGRKRAYSDSESESDRSERKSSKKHKKSNDSGDKKSKKEKKEKREKKEKKHKSDKDKKHKHKKSKKSSRSSP